MHGFSVDATEVQSILSGKSIWATEIDTIEIAQLVFCTENQYLEASPRQELQTEVNAICGFPGREHCIDFNCPHYALCYI